MFLFFLHFESKRELQHVAVCRCTVLHTGHPCSLKILQHMESAVVARQRQLTFHVPFKLEAVRGGAMLLQEDMGSASPHLLLFQKV